MQGADASQALLARRIRSLTDVELGEGEAPESGHLGDQHLGDGRPGGGSPGEDPLRAGDPGRDAVSALVNRHVGSNMPPAALAVPPEAFDSLLAVLPLVSGRPEGVLRTVSLVHGELGESLEAVLACLEKGASEIQMVLPAEAFAPLDEDPDPAFTLLRDLKLACGPRVPLKVLFTGTEFADEELLAEAVDTALQGGADMVGLDLESLSRPGEAGGADSVLDAVLRLTALLSEAERPVGLKLRGGPTVLASIEEAEMALRLVSRFLGSSHPDTSQLRFAGGALDDAVLTLLRREQAARR